MRYRLKVAPDVDRSAIDRVMDFHEEHCPVARSIRGAIAVSTGIDLVEDT